MSYLNFRYNTVHKYDVDVKTNVTVTVINIDTDEKWEDSFEIDENLSNYFPIAKSGYRMKSKNEIRDIILKRIEMSKIFIRGTQIILRFKHRGSVEIGLKKIQEAKQHAADLAWPELTNESFLQNPLPLQIDDSKLFLSDITNDLAAPLAAPAPVPAPAPTASRKRPLEDSKDSKNCKGSHPIYKYGKKCERCSKHKSKIVSLQIKINELNKIVDELREQKSQPQAASSAIPESADNFANFANFADLPPMTSEEIESQILSFIDSPFR
jgi:hypothetical protein